jgi:hypothetical protein
MRSQPSLALATAFSAAEGERYMDTAALAAALGKKLTGGNWNSGIAVLRNNGLIETDSTSAQAGWPALLRGGAAPRVAARAEKLNDRGGYVRSVRLVFEEKAIAYELVPVDMFAPGGPPAEHLARHPLLSRILL